MPVQPSLAQLDLSELEKAIPQEIKSVVLVSNADLHLTTTSLQLIQQLGPCLFIHHNHAHNATTFASTTPNDRAKCYSFAATASATGDLSKAR